MAGLQTQDSLRDPANLYALFTLEFSCRAIVVSKHYASSVMNPLPPFLGKVDADLVGGFRSYNSQKFRMTVLLVLACEVHDESYLQPEALIHNNANVRKVCMYCAEPLYKM